MHALPPTLIAAVLMFSLAACTQPPPAGPAPTPLFGITGSAPGTEQPPNPPASPAGPASAPQMPASPPASGEFNVAVVVDTTTQQVTREQAQGALDQASKFLREFAPLGFAMSDFVEDGSGGSTAEMANRYMAAHASALPNGILIFSTGDNGQARAAGGYGYSVPAPPGFKNRFASLATGDAAMYVAVVDYAYKYMACGYGGSDSASSATSLSGECRGQTGIACVSHNGYSMCSNAVGNLYTLSPTYAASSMIVHGILHNFGPNGDQDHYATPQCNARMGYPTGFFDLQESEYYNGLCPYVYEDFANSYKP